MKRPNLFRLIVPAIFGGILLLSSCNENSEKTETNAEETEVTTDEVVATDEAAKAATTTEDFVGEKEDSSEVVATQIEEVPEEREAKLAPKSEPVEKKAAPAPAPAKKEVAKETASVEEAAAKPAMTFEVKEYDFGEIMQGDKVEYVFKFTNTGNAPLIISNARASCGCTVPEWPKEPIPPGDTGEIDVVFNSAGKSGRQTKSIRISTNIGDQPEVVYLKGNVKLP